MKLKLLNYINKKKAKGVKMLAILLDPDKIPLEEVPGICNKTKSMEVDFIFVGGSFVHQGATQELVLELKKYIDLPIVIFPGDHSQITPLADGLLFLSLLSGRNPEYLIEQQIKAVPLLQNTQLEVIPTGYILIDGGHRSSVMKVSNTTPIPRSDIQLAVDTAVAGMYKGKQLIYLEAGSGANSPISTELIAKVTESINIPLIVGGGIRSKQQLKDAYENGADLVVIGTAFEQNFTESSVLI